MASMLGATGGAVSACGLVGGGGSAVATEVEVEGEAVGGAAAGVAGAAGGVGDGGGAGATLVGGAAGGLARSSPCSTVLIRPGVLATTSGADFLSGSIATT